MPENSTNIYNYFITMDKVSFFCTEQLLCFIIKYTVISWQLQITICNPLQMEVVLYLSGYKVYFFVGTTPENQLYFTFMHVQSF
jgi:hypothetical protein